MTNCQRSTSRGDGLTAGNFEVCVAGGGGLAPGRCECLVGEVGTTAGREGRM